MSVSSIRPQVLLSAHRGGCGRSPDVENTLAAFEAAVLMDVEYVEFDIQRTADGVFILNHDDSVRVHGVRRPIQSLTAAQVDEAVGPRVRYVDVLALLAAAGRKAHLDFKFTSPEDLYPDPAATYEVAAVLLARQYLPDSHFIVTTTEDRSVRAVADWAAASGVEVLVGLSIGRYSLNGMTLWQQARWRLGEVFPARRITRSGANLVVAQRHLARWRLLSWSAKRNLPVLVWTVDSHKEMARLLADARVWMVTSNFPERGVALRNGLAAA